MMSPESIRALARYKAIFEADGMRFATMTSDPGSLPGCEFSDEAQLFLGDAYEHHWVIGGEFSWSDWAQTPEAARLRDDPSAITNASAEQLGKLLTVVIRSDRFCQGALAAAFDSGLLARIAGRAEALAGGR